MKSNRNPLKKRLVVLYYLRDELMQVKRISPKGELRLKQLHSEIKALEESLSIPEYQNIA